MTIVSSRSFTCVSGVSRAKFKVPVVIVVPNNRGVPSRCVSGISIIFARRVIGGDHYVSATRQLTDHCRRTILPPFFTSLISCIDRGGAPFSYPNRRSNLFFGGRPTKHCLCSFCKPRVFRSSVYGTSMALNSLLVRRKPTLRTRSFTTRIFRTSGACFILGKSSSSGGIIAGTLLAPNSLILCSHGGRGSITLKTLVRTKTAPICLRATHGPCKFVNNVSTRYFSRACLHRLTTRQSPRGTGTGQPFHLTIVRLNACSKALCGTHCIISHVNRLYSCVLFSST